MNKRKDLEGFVMTIFVVASLVFLLQVMMNAEAATTKPQFNFANAVYKRTIDGDTFKVDILCIHPIFGKSLSIRVANVDSPEVRTLDLVEKAKGLKAKEFTRKILEEGKDLRLTNCFKGTFSRIICDVSNSKTKNLASDLKKAGHNAKK